MTRSEAFDGSGKSVEGDLNWKAGIPMKTSSAAVGMVPEDQLAVLFQQTAIGVDPGDGGKERSAVIRAIPVRDGGGGSQARTLLLRWGLRIFSHQEKPSGTRPLDLKSAGWFKEEKATSWQRMSRWVSWVIW